MCGTVGSSGECPAGGETLGLISFSQRSWRYRSRSALENTDNDALNSPAGKTKRPAVDATGRIDGQWMP
jgi:hypothetical protein